MNKKQIILAIVAVLSISVMLVSGSLAYLKASTDTPVVNTFTFGDKLADSFELKEHKLHMKDDGNMELLTGTENEVTGNAYTVLPGVDLLKDPFIRITKKSDTAAYLFVKVDFSAFDSQLSYTVDPSKWTSVAKDAAKGYEIFAYTGGAAAPLMITKSNFGTQGTGTVSILQNNKITVPKTADSIATGCKLTFTGYLAQASAATGGATAKDKALSALYNCFPSLKPAT